MALFRRQKRFEREIHNIAAYCINIKRLMHNFANIAIASVFIKILESKGFSFATNLLNVGLISFCCDNTLHLSSPC